MVTSIPSPAISLGVRLQTTVGRNQVMRQTGNYAALYLVPASRIADDYLELAVAAAYASNATETTSNLIVSTSSALLFEGVQADGTVVKLVVTKLLALDSVFASYTLTNTGAVAARININAVYVPVVPVVTP